MGRLPSEFCSKRYIPISNFTWRTIGDAAGIQVSLRDASEQVVYSKSISAPATGGWETYAPLNIGNDIEITETGLYTLRIESVGADGYWQWNADSYTLIKTADEEVEVLGSLTLDDASKYLSTSYTVGESIAVTANYHAGTNHTVTGAQGGVKFFLREMKADWSAVVSDVLAYDPSATGQESGTASANLSLTGLTPSADLPDGNFYFLYAVFDSTDGTTYKIGGVQPISIVAAAEPVIGDLDGDGILSQEDMSLFRATLGSSQGDDNYNTAADLDNDGSITRNDYRLFAIAYRNQ
ncbi:hypothetical protein RS130_10890 [Paraglaciecola aquimarina]|uniref:Dockerin domain-containing protein n=1 Tax=Paraglaciecola aquimarina TaxID=1235557 RepID=A0ABU3SWJ6_9ALTE|nr:dockerin type I domain-containing protein [Paraglaciecola aquimarina]MDU0354371.1 hypothetical protein [Paraglaciecola aquimarina]